MTRHKRKPKEFRARRCASSGKIAHRSPNSAMVHLVSLAHSRAYDGISREVYPCPEHAGEWLIGRARRKRGCLVNRTYYGTMTAGQLAEWERRCRMGILLRFPPGVEDLNRKRSLEPAYRSLFERTFPEGTSA